MMRKTAPRMKEAGAVLLLCVAGWGPCAFGQVVVPGPLVPGPLVPGRAENVILVPQSRPAEGGEGYLPKQETPEGVGKASFDLRKLEIDGVTALDPQTLDEIRLAYEGRHISVADLYEAARKLTEAYGIAGYGLSFAMVPEQKIDNGAARIKAVEGYVARIDLAGSSLSGVLREDDLSAENAAVLASRPLKREVLERYLMTLNERSGVKASARFKASGEGSGASDMTVDVENRMLQAEITANNRSSKEMRRWMAGGAVTLNGFLTGRETLRLGIECGKIGCDKAYTLSARAASLVGTQGAMLTGSYEQSGSRPIDSFLAPLDFYGTSRRESIGMDYPLIKQRELSAVLGGALEGVDARTKTFAGTMTQDRLRMLDIHGSVDVADVWGGSTVARLKLTQGLPVLGATADGSLTKSREAGSAIFTQQTIAAARTQPLGSFVQALDQWTFYMTGEGNASLSGELLSAAQCSYGGSEIGRGYDGGVIAGDHCLKGLIELRRDDMIGNWGVQSYAFGDAGRAWVRGSLYDGQERSTGAGSTGLGVRLAYNDAISTDLQLAFPLRAAFAESQKASPRLFFSFKAKY